MKLFFVKIFLLFSFVAFSQKKYEFSGVIKLNGDDKTLITYTLNFSLKNNVVEGFSITDIGGPHETKNTITGTYNDKTKAFKFSESQILYTKSMFERTEFCYVFFEKSLKIDDDLKKIEGNFTGKYKDGKTCINGTILLVNQKKIEKTIAKFNTKIQKSNKVEEKTKEQLNLHTIIDSLKVNYLLKGQNLSVFSSSKVVTVEIWDNKKEDGDAINLYQNNKLILKEYTVLNKKKTIEIELNGESTVLKIEATKEGDIKPNTTMIRIIDGANNYELMSNLKKWETASITFINQAN
jgi:hypothetical protein